ncbi:MAG: cupin domain-containing protein [Sedimentisphaerales bacterium]|nr:cupin domain-containing protein [Sedimentisphaerales bacterium]
MTRYLVITFLAVLLTDVSAAQDPVFLKRSVDAVSERPGDLSTETAHYRPLFGVGDPNAGTVTGLTRFGHLTVDPDGRSRLVNYPNEEQIYYVLDGTGLLHYGPDRIPVAPDDFMYLPAGIEHGVSNPRENPLRLIAMGFALPAERQVPPTPRLMLANASDVPLQVLGQHGPTTQFKLLLGTTRSRRDKLAAAHQVNSLFLMDFAAGGTNIPHRHPREGEIYFVLRGHGEMVAGTDAQGEELRYAARAGDAFYFAPRTLIGFYSGASEGQAHDVILAVRWAVTSSGPQR